MENPKLNKLLERCTNYNRIIYHNYSEDDLLTHQIINLYKEYLLSVNMTECELITCEMYDKIIKEYLDNQSFRKFLLNHYKAGHFEDFVIKDKIVELYDKYQNERLTPVTNIK